LIPGDNKGVYPHHHIWSSPGFHTPPIQLVPGVKQLSVKRTTHICLVQMSRSLPYTLMVWCLHRGNFTILLYSFVNQIIFSNYCILLRNWKVSG
jgi:hypothetical protein